ncbi:SRPBCC family protein [Tenggerimyces flavus]|uniref:SRPBCC family protein n=1 Tax=Tenggerimyces flavus TaxID=1708749 RepID=A0ABV7YIB5_9ACTN|nr:SRPBCC family protein [Tenggerimyces flavus]MBM7789322.1 uncharacterized protein YndB with AHSA1/START domain [Tenggerimyces flavus]
MNATTKNEATIEADPKVPTVKIVREFDATPDRVFNAWVDPELIVQWLGPNGTEMNLDRWDAKTGGGWKYHEGGGESFYGSFHEIRQNERIVQTFTWAGYPDGVALETITFEPLDGGRCRVTTLSVVDTFEGRDMIVSSGMEVGVIEGYQRLDALLAQS